MQNLSDITEFFVQGYSSQRAGNYTRVIHADCMEWLGKVQPNSIHAIVTDPPYGIKEYDLDQLEKRANGNGGVWRIPPSFDGHKRAPLPRFTALTNKDRERLYCFFSEWCCLVSRALRPGGHIFIATNAVIAPLLYEALSASDLEFRGQVIRLVKTLRGGDRPKNAEKEYPDVSVLPRGCYEPWGIFRKSLLPNMKVSDCLKEFQTGGLRRYADGTVFEDVIQSHRTPKKERSIANHPSLKPQSFLRRLVYVSLPLGEGVVVDPFMGSGSTVAAGEAIGIHAIGVERHNDYYNSSIKNVSLLKNIKTEVDELVEVYRNLPLNF